MLTFLKTIFETYKLKLAFIISDSRVDVLLYRKLRLYQHFGRQKKF